MLIKRKISVQISRRRPLKVLCLEAFVPDSSIIVNPPILLSVSEVPTGRTKI